MRAAIRMWAVLSTALMGCTVSGPTPIHLDVRDGGASDFDARVGLDDIVPHTVGAAPCGGQVCEAEHECEVALCTARGCEHRELADGAACSAGVCGLGVCRPQGCGDGWVDTASGEQCDDGNQTDGDGCTGCGLEPVALSGAGYASRPVVASDGTGAALVAWVETHSGAREIRCARMARTGTPLDASSILVSRVSGLGTEVELAVAGLQTGGWALAWSGAGVDADGLGIRLARIDGAGAVGRSIVATEEQRGDQLQPALATTSTEIVLAWTDRRIPDEGGAVGAVWARAFDLSAATASPSSRVSDLDRPAGEPALASWPEGHALAWVEGPIGMETFRSRVVVRRFADGEWRDAAPIELGRGHESGPRIAALEDGALEAAWVSRRGEGEGGDLVRHRHVDALGVPEGAAPSSLGTPATVADRPALSAIEGAAFAAGWISAGEGHGLKLKAPEGGEAPGWDALYDLTRDRQAGEPYVASADRGVWAVWTERSGGRRVARAQLLAVTSGCTAPCGGYSPYCNRETGYCDECRATAECPIYDGAVSSCDGGACSLDCLPGRANCTDDPSCETHILADPTNCGSCGNVCGSGRVCSAGACVCAPGRTLCGGQCLLLASDVANCGSCGRDCRAYSQVSSAVCSAGDCQFVCAAGRADCDAVDSTGCETSTLTSSLHCGMCGRSCNTAGGQYCSAGNCVYPPPVVSTSASTYASGATIGVDYWYFPGNVMDRIVIARPGTVTGYTIVSATTGGQISGGRSFSVTLPAGQYVARGISSTGALLASSSTFTVTGSAPTVSSLSPLYAGGTSAQINYANVGTAASTRLVIAPYGSADTSVTMESTLTTTTGSRVYGSLPQGRYVARVFIGTGALVRIAESHPFSVSGVGQAAVVTQYPSYAAGTNVVNVYWVNLGAHPTDRIAISEPGWSATRYWVRVNSTGANNGSVGFASLRLPPGTYVARAFDQGTTTMQAESPTFPVTGTAASMGVTLSMASVVAPMTSFSVSFAGFFPSTTDWISVAPVGMADTMYSQLRWSPGTLSGSVTFTGLPAGDYEARGYFNWGTTQNYVPVVRRTFRVGS